MVETPYLVATEYQFVVLEQIVSVLIYVYLKGGVERMLCQPVMVGECYYIISEPFQCLVNIFRPKFAFVQRSRHSGVCMEIGSFPALGCVEGMIWIVDVRSAEWNRRSKTINRTEACCTYGQDGCDDDTSDSLAYDSDYLPGNSHQNLSMMVNMRSLISSIEPMPSAS